MDIKSVNGYDMVISKKDCFLKIKCVSKVTETRDDSKDEGRVY